MDTNRYYVSKTKPLDHFKTIMHQVLVAGPMLEHEALSEAQKLFKEDSQALYAILEMVGEPNGQH